MRRLTATRQQIAQFLSATLKSVAVLAVSTSLIGCGWTASHVNKHSSTCGVAYYSADCGSEDNGCSDDGCSDASCTEAGCVDSCGTSALMDKAPAKKVEESSKPVPAPNPPSNDKESEKRFPPKPAADAQTTGAPGRKRIVRPRTKPEASRSIPESILQVSLPESHRPNATRARFQSPAPEAARSQVVNAVVETVKPETPVDAASKRQGRVTIQGEPSGPGRKLDSKAKLDSAREFPTSTSDAVNPISRATTAQVESMSETIPFLEDEPEKKPSVEASVKTSTSSSKPARQSTPKALDPALELINEAFQWQPVR